MLYTESASFQELQYFDLKLSLGATGGSMLVPISLSIMFSTCLLVIMFVVLEK